MILRSFTDQIPAAVGAALADFEREFSYPLGDVCRFRISHGSNYLTFFRAMGAAELLIADDEGNILGGIVRVGRLLTVNDVAKPFPVHYLCDLKLKPARRGGTVLARLIRGVKQTIEASGFTACYCVVMEGTGRLPTHYTGRLGVPEFLRLGDIMILRLSSDRADGAQVREVAKEAFNVISESIEKPGFRPLRDAGEFRSMMAPRHLVSADGRACGILEDTRRGKRLILETGEEMLSAHLSAFKYLTVASAAMLLTGTLALARAEGVPALFVAVPLGEFPQMMAALSGLEATVAPAVVYGHGLEAGVDWWIDTAEI